MTNLPSHSPSSSYHHLLATKFHPPLNSLAEGITGRTLLPPKADPYARARARLQADHISRMLVPVFYRFFQAQDLDAQAAAALEFSGAVEQLTSLPERGEREMVAKGGPRSGAELDGCDGRAM